MPRLPRLTVMVLPLLATACLEDPVECTADARASLIVSVSDDADVAIDDATVTAVVDDEAPEACDAQGDGSYLCPFFERTGTFVVTASKAGFATASDEVTVGTDECHVIAERVDLVLVPE